MTLPTAARNARRIGGGDINEAWRVTLADGTEAFVKTRQDAAPGEYALEAAGLRWLADPGALPLPQVLEIGVDYLVLEWVQPGRLDDAGIEQLGRGLAELHGAGAPHFGDPFGAAPAGEPAAPCRFGSLQLPNECAERWSAFYAQRRLQPLQRLAAESGWLTGAASCSIDRVCERIEELAGPPEPPARLHGDLWGGNVHADNHGRPWLIDPAAYGGHREVDLAMLRLFGVPSERLFAAYEEVAPLATGWQERVELWQLAPLLVHGVLFGGGYCSAAERIAHRYGG